MSEAYFPVESGALGPEENFLSLDDILMSQEKLPVRVETAMPRLGAFFLERGASAQSDQALPQGTKLELPLWLAKGLYDNKRRILSVELPKMYQEGWRTVFSADANVVDLHKMGPHFYGFGSQLLHFDSPESTDISQSLLQILFSGIETQLYHFESGLLKLLGQCWHQFFTCTTETFIGRFRRIMDSSQNSYNEDTSALVARLDETERGLFQTGQKGLNDFQSWEKGQTSQITASSLVQNYKKRKFTNMED